MPPAALRPAALLAQAEAAQRSGRFDEAEGYLRQVLARQPELPQALHMLAVCRARAGAPEEGLALLTRAVALRPKAPELRRAQAFLLQRLGRRDEAIAALQALLAVAPQDPQAGLALAGLLSEAQRSEEAGSLLQAALEDRPRDPLVMNALGALALRQGWAGEALAWFERAIGAAPAGFAEAEHNRATALADLGRIADSAAAAERALSLEPRLTAAAWHLALCDFDAGRTARAQERLRAALRTAPLPMAEAYLAALLEEGGEQAAAESHWHRARAGGPHLTALAEAVAYRRAVLARPGPDRPGEAPRAFGFKASALRHAATAALSEGLVLEFGVFTGRSLRILAEALPARHLHGFDSFAGLPSAWIPGEDRGAYSTGGRLPAVPDNVSLVEGWFEDSLPPFLASRPEPLALAHIDCDLYGSTATVLGALAPRLVPGSLLIFDEYFAYDGWREHEFKAFQELAAARGLAYDYLSLSPFTRQAVVRIAAP